MKLKKLSLLPTALATLFATATLCVAVSGADLDLDMGDFYKTNFVVDDVIADLDSGTATVNVSVKRNAGFAGLVGAIVYDNDAFTLESAPILSDKFAFDKTDGENLKSPYAIILSSDKNIVSDGVLLTYKFKLKSGADAGRYDISFKTEGFSENGVSFEVLDANGKNVSNVVTSGSITVSGYSITYNANGGSGAPESALKTKDKDFTISSAVPTRYGYTFLGWAKSATATQKDFSAGDKYSENKDLTLYAVWQKNAVSAGDLGLEVSTENGRVGDTVTVNVNITNNPGIGSMAFDVVYDNEALELVGCETAFGSDGWVHSALDRYDDKINFRYMNLSNLSGTGTAIKLKFKIKSSKTEGLKSVTIVPEEGEFYKFGDGLSEIDVNVVASGGGVNVTLTIIGDLNRDGVVNQFDRAILSKYLAGWEGFEADTFDYAAADLNGDGVVNQFDRTILSKYLAGWEGYENLPYAG